MPSFFYQQLYILGPDSGQVLILKGQTHFRQGNSPKPRPSEDLGRKARRREIGRPGVVYRTKRLRDGAVFALKDGPPNPGPGGLGNELIR